MQKSSDYKEFSLSIRVLGASYDAFIDDAKIQAYWVNLEREPLQTVQEVCLQLTRAQRDEDARMPNAQYIRRLCQSHMHAQSYEMPCQQPGCLEVLPWPPRGEAGEDSYFCWRHQPETSHPATREERLSIIATLTAKGKAFVRRALRELMADIPVTPEEAEAAAQQQVPSRPRMTPQEPGVNAAWFKERVSHIGSSGWMVEYKQRREVVANAGYRWDQAESVWRKAKRILTDEQIDTMDQSILMDFVSR